MGASELLDALLLWLCPFSLVPVIYLMFFLSRRGSVFFGSSRESSPAMFRIAVVCISHGLVMNSIEEICVWKHTRVSRLRSTVASTVGWHPDHFELSYQGLVLADRWLLSECRITSGCSVFALL